MTSLFCSKICFVLVIINLPTADLETGRYTTKLLPNPLKTFSIPRSF